jgi:protein arginine kinase activator
MVCDQCKEREAVVHLTQIVEEQVTTQHLCERCAAERGVESSTLQPKTPLGSFLAAMGKAPGARAPGARAACPGCGATLQDFREAGRLGCSECYATFGGELRDLLRRLHGSTTHVGDRYQGPGSTGPVDPGPAEAAAPDPAEALRERLRAAVAAENFELAAELRDRLRVVEGVE